MQPFWHFLINIFYIIKTTDKPTLPSVPPCDPKQIFVPVVFLFDFVVVKYLIVDIQNTLQRFCRELTVAVLYAKLLYTVCIFYNPGCYWFCAWRHCVLLLSCRLVTAVCVSALLWMSLRTWWLLSNWKHPKSQRTSNYRSVLWRREDSLNEIISVS